MKPVIQMRVEVEEKAQLLAEAKAEGINLSDLLRRRCLRGAAPVDETDVLAGPPPKFVEVKPVSYELFFQRRVNYFKNARGMTTKRAEDAARKEAA